MSTTRSYGRNGENAMSGISPDTTSLLRALHIAALVGLSLFVSASADASTATAKQETFASPEQAGEALAAAWRRGSKADILKIFGPAGVKLVSSGDAIADREAKKHLAAAYDKQHKFERDGNAKALLVIGEREFPFPIPLVRQANVWRFDTHAGADEILNRRIGRNELEAIEVCRAYVESQFDYADKDPLGNGLHEYAMKIVSSGDKHDGLYWPTKPGDEESPLGPLFARAADEGYNSASANMLAPYHGYYYRILTRQGTNAQGGASNYLINGHMTGGFALVTFPAKYGSSGIMTFIVNQDGIVFQKNLGPDTARIARRMTTYDPDQTWRIP